jgi:hypothetical protein
VSKGAVAASAQLPLRGDIDIACEREEMESGGVERGG